MAIGRGTAFSAEASSRLEETSKVPAIGHHFAGACCPAYMRTRSVRIPPGNLATTTDVRTKDPSGIFHDFEWLPRNELLLRCDEASSCPKWVSRPWSMGRWRQQDSKLADGSPQANSCGLRRLSRGPRRRHFSRRLKRRLAPFDQNATDLPPYE